MAEPGRGDQYGESWAPSRSILEEALNTKEPMLLHIQKEGDL